MQGRYSNNETKKTVDGRTVYKPKIYPNIPLRDDDLYVATETGDRLDTLAYDYYRDSTLWWIISVANNNVTKGTLYPVPGTQLRIPIEVAGIISLYNQINQAR